MERSRQVSCDAVSDPDGALRSAEEVAEVICFFLREQSSMVHGTNLLIDGGFVAG